MKALLYRPARLWSRLGPQFLPFADAATAELPLGRLLRLSLFQVSVGMALVLLMGTLNRVMILEMGVPAALVAGMIAIPILFAPLRALIGFRSDHHRSALGWRRVPYIWMGTMLQFGGLAMMPFALLVLSMPGGGPPLVGPAAAGFAFLLVGAGLHTTQTAGLALATDLATPETRPRVVALLYVTLLAGMGLSALLFGLLLRDFSPMRLIQVIQGAAVITLVLNVIALWKQEGRDPTRTRHDQPRPAFGEAWRRFRGNGRATRLLVAIGFGTAAFNMQDILLEPYGGEILNLSVAATTTLTAIWAAGMLLGLALSARRLGRGANPYSLAGYGALVGVAAFTAVILSAPLEWPLLFRAGTFLIGFGGGLFAVGTLTAAMTLASGEHSGLALGAWGAVQAVAAGVAVALGGGISEVVGQLAASGALWPSLSGPAIGYSVVYHIEIVLLFATLAIIGPLVGTGWDGARVARDRGFGLADFPS